MINTQPVEFPGIQEVLDNSDFYKQKLLDDSIIVFRNANLTNDDQSFFHAELGKLFNYSIIKKEEDKTDDYVENHSARELIGIAEANNILLPWHIEHLYYKNPIVISTWNMTKFTTDSENGKTYFIDSEKAYNAMPEIWKSFLNLCKINHHSLDASVDDFSPVVNHWISGNPLIRLAPRKDEGSGSTLKSVDNREATQTEKDLFEEIFMWFGDYVYNNEEDRIVHKWQQGDLVIVDIFKMPHAVAGGFDPADREFVGMWGYKDPTS